MSLIVLVLFHTAFLTKVTQLKQLLSEVLTETSTN